MDITTKTLPSAMIGSLLGHLAIALILFLAQMWIGRSPVEPVREPLVIELPPLKKEKQIVDSKQGKKTEQAPEDSFLGKENRVVQKQMVAKPREIGPQHLSNSGTKKGPLSKFGLNLLKPSPEGTVKSQDAPDFAKFQESFGAVNQEFVKGLAEGEQTALNTREFVFFSYFQRIREQLDRAWRPVLKEQIVRMYNRGRMLATDKEHTTKTVVTLNGVGEITRIQLLEESGTRDLDEAAIKAFNKAGPFPNPPKQLVDDTGQIEIRWDFILRT